MNFAGEIDIAAPREAVFAKLCDAEFFASCIEGVRDLVAIDDRRYTAVLETRIAYMRFRFNVTVELAKVEAPSRVEARTEGTPIGVVGRLTASSAANLSETPEGTRVSYEIDVALTGKLGSLGRPVLRAKAKEMEKQFASNLQAAFAAAGAGAAP